MRGEKRELKLFRGVFACLKPQDGRRAVISFLKSSLKRREILCLQRSLSIMDILDDPQRSLPTPNVIL